MNKIDKVSKILNEFFNERAEAKAVEKKFIKRYRKIRGSSFLKSLVLGNLEDGKSSIENICQILQEDKVSITKQGLEFRFTEEAAEYMKLMYNEAFTVFKNEIKIECELLKKFTGIKLLDSSYISLPNTMEGLYQGYATSYPNQKEVSKSGVKLQVSYDYLNQVLNQIDIKDGKSSDQGYRDYLENIKEKELHIADLGYFVPAALKKIISKEGYFISRYKSDTNVYDAETGEKMDLLEYIKNKDKFEKEIILGKEAKLKVRMVGLKLSNVQAEARRRKANKLAKSHGYKSSKNNQRLLNWSIFITNVKGEELGFEDIFKVYKIRWQIELLFKLYKSHINLDKVKSKVNQSKILCEFYAKLIAIVIFHGIANCAEMNNHKEFSLVKAMINFKKRAREMVFVIRKNCRREVSEFIKNLVNIWEKFAIKDRYRKKRISTLQDLKYSVIQA